MTATERRYLLIDGRNLLWRAVEALATLKAGDTATGGVFGFLTSLITIYQRYGGQVVVAWEGHNNFRYRLWPDYKKKQDTPERLQKVALVKAQELTLKGLLCSAGIRQYSGIECEADDVLGTLALRVAGNDTAVYVYTMDSDLRQIVAKGVSVVSAGWHGEDRIFDVDAVRKRYHLEPEQIPDLKALAGDASDNIPGVAGVGEKTAAKLLQLYRDVDGVLGAAEDSTASWPVPLRFKLTLIDDADRVRLFRKLTCIKRDARLQLLRPVLDRGKLLDELRRYHMATLIDRVSLLLAAGQPK